METWVRIWPPYLILRMLFHFFEPVALSLSRDNVYFP